MPWIFAGQWPPSGEPTKPRHEKVEKARGIARPPYEGTIEWQPGDGRFGASRAPPKLIRSET